ncbi:MAG: hypothetical protein RLZZ597_77 [Cyanobacteriota bacterium]|jgi:hypothetical protein
MTQVNRLQVAVRTHLPWHGARLTFLGLILVALFWVETVNLDKLSSVFANWAKPESSYNRLTRFLRGFPVDFDDIARAIVSWSQIPQPWTLSLDRTTPISTRCFNFCPRTEGAFSDAAQCFSKIWAAYRGYQKIAVEQRRRRGKIGSWEKQNIVAIKAKKEYVLAYLEKSFSERSENFVRLFDLADKAIGQKMLKS